MVRIRVIFVICLSPMKRITLFLLAFFPFLEASGQADKLYGGVAQLNITPKTGYPHYRDFGTAVDDSLYVKALVFRQGNAEWAIAVCDLLWIERELSADVRVAVSAKTGIPYDNIMLTATHTHTGPAYHGNIYELNNHIRKFDGTPEEAIGMHGYPAFLKARITEAIVKAHESLVPVTVMQVTDSVTNLSFNRRYVMKDGKVKTNPGKGNPDIVKAAGPIDPELHMLFIEKASDKSLIGVVSNFAVHSDTYGGKAFSADYPGVLARRLAEKIKGSFVSVFLQGASGDLNHFNVKKDSEPLTTDKIGSGLAERVAASRSGGRMVPKARVGAASEFVYAPLQAYNAGELSWAKDAGAESPYGETGLFKLRRPMKIRSLERIRQQEAIPPTIGTEPWTLPVEVQVFRLSDDVAVVGLPGEIFADLGLAIKKASPFKTTLFVELTNSHIAYVPTRKAFSQGSYETLNSRLAPGGGELMVESAIRQLKELKR